MNTRLEAHKCGLGTHTRGALGTIGSGPNRHCQRVGLPADGVDYLLLLMNSRLDAVRQYSIVIAN